MKKLVLGLLVLFSALELKAQRYDGVDPCAGPNMRRTLIDSASVVLVSTEVTAGVGGGLFCGAVISSGAMDLAGATNLNDYLVCADTRPVSGGSLIETGAASTVGAAPFGSQIAPSTDTRGIFPALIAASAAVAGLPASFRPVPFRNLFCDINNIRTTGVVYWVPAVR